MSDGGNLMVPGTNGIGACRDGCSFVPTKTRWHDRDRFRPRWAGCNQCRDCAKRIDL